MAHIFSPHLTFSVRAATLAPMALLVIASHIAIGGRLPTVLLLAVISCLRIRQVQCLKTIAITETVLPFAVLYGRGEERQNLELCLLKQISV